MYHTETINCSRPAPSPRIHSDLLPGVLLARQLIDRKLLDPIADHIRLARTGGYCGLDLFLGLLVYLASKQKRGIRPFHKAHKDDMLRVAHALGRRSLPSPPSISRMCGSASAAMVAELGPFLLTEVADLTPVLAHPAVQNRDAQGNPWHVFDRDGRVLPHRRRALPRGDDLPEPIRCSEGAAAPGHSGRKRADVQVHRSTLIHYGSGATINIHLEPGNGDRMTDVRLDLDALERVAVHAGLAKDRILLRTDGEFGDVPMLHAVADRGIAYLSRLTRPRLLDQPEIQARMRQGTWHHVDSSLSGPRRSAMDLGEVELTPGRTTRTPEGEHYAPIRARVVVSRCPLPKRHDGQEPKASVGRAIDRWQFECFVMLNLPPDAWPAPAAVALYFQRAGAETRFHHEDRAMRLDRVFSWHLPGRELAILVGLFIHNWYLSEGFALGPPATAVPPPPPASYAVDTRPLPDALFPTSPNTGPKPPNPSAAKHTTSAHTDAPLALILDRIDWTHQLQHREGWAYERQRAALTCPNGKELPVTTVGAHPEATGRARIQFRAPAGTCTDCPMRSRCTTSARKQYSKLVLLSIPEAVGGALRPVLDAVQRARRQLASTQRVHRKRPPDEPPRTETRPFEVQLPAREAQPTHTPDGPFLRPETVRSRYTELVQQVQMDVQVTLPKAKRVDPALVFKRSQRQRRRQTWEQRRARYALPEGARVDFNLVAAETVLQRLRLQAGDPRPG